MQDWGVPLAGGGNQQRGPERFQQEMERIQGAGQVIAVSEMERERDFGHKERTATRELEKREIFSFLGRKWGLS